jgi:predicted phage replisome organizer
MAESKKYYWLKLKRDFFKRHDIRIIEEMPNGKDYILFYLKLLLESIDHEGNLRFSETIPYNEQMLSVVTNTNIDVVRSAMKIFVELHMMDILDDQTIFMTEVDKLIGSETEWAKKKRLQRRKEDNVPSLSSKCPTEIEKEKDKEKEPYIEAEVVSTATATAAESETVENSVDDEDGQLKCIGGTLGKGVVYLTDAQYGILLDKLGLEGFNRYVDRLSSFILEKNAYVKSHYETILKWHKEDTAVREG